MFVSSANLPFRSVENKWYRRSLTSLNINAKDVFISAQTVSRDLKEAAKLAEPEIRIYLQDNVKGDIHVSFDGWSAKNAASFVGVTAHFVREGQMSQFLLDFIK
jgi:hypothetical protein